MTKAGTYSTTRRAVLGGIATAPALAAPAIADQGDAKLRVLWGWYRQAAEVLDPHVRCCAGFRTPDAPTAI
jgi:hypothetical protein